MYLLLFTLIFSILIIGVNFNLTKRLYIWDIEYLISKFKHVDRAWLFKAISNIRFRKFRLSGNLYRNERPNNKK
jgi:hypothetical protein